GVELREERGRIDGMDEVEGRAGFARLVRLQVADQMPPDREVGAPGNLLESFLHFVLAEIDLTLRGGGAHVLDAERLRNRDQPDRGRIAPCAPRRVCDLPADALEPRGDVDHSYFLSCATSDFAVAEFGPSGASFRYVSNSDAAPARLPSFTSAIP